jgi:hypothetical protein
MVHDRESVAQDLRLLHVMGRQEDRDALGLEDPDDLPE